MTRNVPAGIGLAVSLAVAACGGEEPAAPPENPAPAKIAPIALPEPDPSPKPGASVYQAIAAYWAPAIENDTSRPEYRNDFITRVDFDGDWSALNNWDNRESPLPAAVYWWAVQTRTHAFLGYGLYRLANQEDPPELNEMQGAIVVVRRSPETDDQPRPDPGRFETLLIWSHDRYDAFAELDKVPDDPELARTWNARLKPAGSIRRAKRSATGDVNFLLDRFGVHPVLYSDADAHRLAQGPPARPGGTGMFDVPLTDWRHKDYLDPRATAGETWGDMRGTSQDGVMYAYANRSALSMVGSGGKGRGRFKHHWEIVGYELIDLHRLWERRRDQQLFRDTRMFAGDGRFRALHLAPWAWTEDTPGLKGLEPVRDPGALLAALVGLPEPFDPKPLARSFPLED